MAVTVAVSVLLVAPLVVSDPAGAKPRVARPAVSREAPLLRAASGRVQGKGGVPGAEKGIEVASNPAAGNVSADLLEAMQRGLKVTASQARARLVRADWAARLNKPLRQRLGRAYAGSWLAADGQEFVVAITDPTREQLVRASGATPKLVARNAAQLSAIGATLDRHASKTKSVPKTVAGWVVDPQAQAVTIMVLPGGRPAAERFVGRAGLSPNDVTYKTVPRRFEKMSDLKGGHGLVMVNDQGATNSCSAGFAVRTATGKRGMLTAGHCYSPGGFGAVYRDVRPLPVTNLDLVGFVHGAAYGGSHDEALILSSNTSRYRPVPRVHGYGRPDVKVDDGAEQVAGSPVCLSGAVGGLQCGKILSGDWSYPDDFGGTISPVKATDTCSQPGDSGGAVISGNHAQGIFAAGNRASTSCGLISGIFARSLYIPLSRALASFSNFGVSLLTTPTPPTSPPVPSLAWTTDKSSWTGLGGAIVGNVAPVSLGADNVRLFGRGTDNRLYTNASVDGAWSGWLSLGAADALTGPPTVLARSGGIDVYYRGVDTRPYLRRWNGSAWEAPVKLGDVDVEGTIAAVSPQPGHVILFIRSSDDEVKYNFNDGTGWSGWLGLGGDTNASPTAIARTNAAGQTVLEVYARWADDNVRYRRLDPAGPPGWQPWVNLGGIFKDTPVGVTVGPNQSWLIGWARDDTVHVQRFKNGDWLRGGDGTITTGWRGLGGNVASQPTVVAGPGEQMRVFGRDANQRINMITWPGWKDVQWETWVPLDGDTVVPVGAGMRAGGGEAGLIDTVGIDAATGQPFHTTVDAFSTTPRLTVSRTAFDAGEPAYLTVTGPPGAPVYWTSTRDGNQVENHSFYGQHLDSEGTLTVMIEASAPGGSVGQWVKQAQGMQTQLSAEVTYTVRNRPVTLATDKSTYQVGDDVTVMVTGPPYAPIYWSSTVNGVTSGETDAFYNQFLDPSGMFVGVSRWTDTRAGTWVKQVRAGVSGPTAQVTFQVTGPPAPAPPALQAKQMAAAASSDDRMHAVALGDDQRYWTREQSSGSWSQWYPLGNGTFSTPPTAVVNAAGRVEVYGVGTDAVVYRNVHNGTGPDGWSGWLVAQGCCIRDKVSVTKDKFNRLNLFGRGYDDQVYVSRQTDVGANTFTGWQGLGGSVNRGPSAVGFYWYHFYYIFVFATGHDGNVYIYNRIEDADPNTRTYGAWAQLGGPVAGMTAVATPSGNANTLRPFALFVRGTDNRIYYYNDAAVSFDPLGDGPFAGDPVAVAGGTANVLSVMGLGADHQVHHNRWTCLNPPWCPPTGWSGWSLAGPGTLLAEPAAARLSTERLQAFGLDPGRQPVINNQAQQHTQSWSGWSQAW